VKRSAAAAKAVVVQDLRQAELVLALARAWKNRVEIWSAPGAAARGGVGWFAALARLAAARVPGASPRFVLDCAGRADLVQEAFREGLRDACFTGRRPVADRLAAIALKSRARLHLRRPAAFDVGAALERSPQDMEARLRDYLRGN